MPDSFSFTDPLTSAVTTVSFHIGGLPEDQKGEASTEDTVRGSRNGDVYIDVKAPEVPFHTFNCHWDVFGPASNLNSYLAMRALRSQVGTLTRVNGDPPMTIYLRAVNYSRRDWNSYTEGSIMFAEVG
jgi:hypothetical protein